ncbi:MAG: phosphoribosylamine--glycine ligase [Pseudomonadota bacterium]
MKVLILGGGGREHALAWKIAHSPIVTQLFCAPGNAGIGQVAKCVDGLDINNGAEVVAFCQRIEVGFVVIGPEAPLAAGVADQLRANGIGVFGPNKAAAQLEASKAFTKEICDACGAPTAAWARFSERDTALAHVRQQGAPIVIKADGLAAGKGVVVAETLAQAETAIEEMFAGAFGSAGAEVVIEEFMDGEEASFFVLTDGRTVLPLPTAQDHKRVGEGDTGPNTGGMGAYSPAPVMTTEMQKRALEEIIHPVITEMARRGMRYQGVLYAGLMIDANGPRLVEINARFGDPECQPLMMRLKSDLLPALMACDGNTLPEITLEWSEEPAITVVMAAKGYPGSYDKGDTIEGLDAAEQVDGVKIFHAGTRTGPGGIEAAGGRVLNITASGKDISEARERAYEAVDLIDWPGGFVRRDIAWRVLS